MFRMMGEDHRSRPRLTPRYACSNGDLITERLKSQKMRVPKSLANVRAQCVEPAKTDHAADRNGSGVINCRDHLAQQMLSFFFAPSLKLLFASSQVHHVKRFSEAFVATRI